MKNLGNWTLFLSKASSVSVRASEMGCKGNRIYYIPSASDKAKGVFGKFQPNQALYVAFELGRDDGFTIPSNLPYTWGKGHAWVTPICLP